MTARIAWSSLREERVFSLQMPDLHCSTLLLLSSIVAATAQHWEEMVCSETALENLHDPFSEEKVPDGFWIA
jgi:hypothetical protein